MAVLLYVGLAAVSAAALLYEIALTRLFSVAHGYHFAFLAVSLALLGFGASGTALALRRRVPSPSGRALGLLAAGSAVGLVAGYVAANEIPFDAYRVAWEPSQFLLLAGYLLSLAAPFFLVGLVQGWPLVAWPERSGRLYAAALAGSGIGCLLALAALAQVGGERAVVLAALLGAAGGLALAAPDRTALLASGAAALALGLLVALSSSWLEPRLSPYKPLSQLLIRPDTSVVGRQENAFSRVDVVKSGSIRSAPGLSLAYQEALPSERALVVDGETVLPLPPPSLPRRLFDALPTALPYLLRPSARALVLEPGGGLDVRAALAGGARPVVAVERNPLVVRLARAAHVYDDPRVRVVAAGPRAWLAGTEGRFDVVALSLAENFRPVTAGAFSLTETYVLTREAFDAYLAHLATGGLLAVHRWLQLPPTEELRAAALAAGALRRAGIDPRQSLAALRSFSTMLILAKRGPLTATEIAAVKAFARERRFDLVYYPGMRRGEANRFNVLRGEDPYFARFQDLLADPERLYGGYEYDVRPVDDDRPFFFQFFKWEQTPTVLKLLGKTWQPFGGSGYLVLAALLVLAAALSLVLVAAPVVAALARGEASPGWAWTTAYFGALGLGFLLVEVALLQRFILFLDNPAYALSIVLFGLLVFSGLGSALSHRAPWPAALATAVLFAALYPRLLSAAFSAFLGEPLAVRVTLAIVLLAPLGFVLGMPFPHGLRFLGRAAPAWLPLAWGVNGFASVVSAVLAALLALSVGLGAVFGAGALAYAVALAAVIASRARGARRARL